MPVLFIKCHFATPGIVDIYLIYGGYFMGYRPYEGMPAGLLSHHILSCTLLCFRAQAGLHKEAAL